MKLAIPVQSKCDCLENWWLCQNLSSNSSSRNEFLLGTCNVFYITDTSFAMYIKAIIYVVVSLTALYLKWNFMRLFCEIFYLSGQKFLHSLKMSVGVPNECPRELG